MIRVIKNLLVLYTINLLSAFLCATIVLNANNDYLKLFGSIAMIFNTALAIINAQKIIGGKQ